MNQIITIICLLTILFMLINYLIIQRKNLILFCSTNASLVLNLKFISYLIKKTELSSYKQNLLFTIQQFFTIKTVLLYQDSTFINLSARIDINYNKLFLELENHIINSEKNKLMLYRVDDYSVYVNNSNQKSLIFITSSSLDEIDHFTLEIISILLIKLNITAKHFISEQ